MSFDLAGCISVGSKCTVDAHYLEFTSTLLTMSSKAKTLPPSAVQSSVARLYVANRQKWVCFSFQVLIWFIYSYLISFYLWIYQEARCQFISLSEVSAVWPLHVRMQREEEVCLSSFKNKDHEKAKTRTQATRTTPTPFSLCWEEETTKDIKVSKIEIKRKVSFF